MANETETSFTCDLCKKTFDKMPVGDAKAEAEYPEVFGVERSSDDGIVCDDCWQRIDPRKLAQA